MDNVWTIIILLIAISIIVNWIMLPFVVSSIKSDLGKLIELIEEKL